VFACFFGWCVCSLVCLCRLFQAFDDCVTLPTTYSCTKVWNQNLSKRVQKTLAASFLSFSALIRARKYSQRKLLRELLSAGFQGKMDFMYLPIDPRTRASRGFAFCNFTSPQARSKKESGWSNGPNQKLEMLLVPICSGLACEAYKILHMYIICY
jgi:hypothetical protein